MLQLQARLHFGSWEGERKTAEIMRTAIKTTENRFGRQKTVTIAEKE